MINSIDIEVPRNGHYQENWQIRAIDFDADGKIIYPPIDLTGHTLELDVRLSAGQGSVVASADIDIWDAVNGNVTITLAGANFSSVQGVAEIVKLAYDLKDIYPDGIIKVYPRGNVLLIPGVS